MTGAGDRVERGGAAGSGARARPRGGARLRLAALGLAAAALAACTDLPPPGDEPAPPAVTRSAESLQLERYYAAMQSRLRARGLLRTDDGGPDAPFTAETLVRNFERIALYDEYAVIGGRFVPRQTPSVLRRWDRPVRIGLVIGDLVPPAMRRRFRADVTAYAARLSRLTGHPITVTDERPNLMVMFVYKDEAARALDRVRKAIPRLNPAVAREIADAPANTFCVAYAFSSPADPGRYTSAVILIKAEHPELMRLSCIHEELAQSLGLANDSPVARPSIFNDDEEFALLTRHDALLLKMLYDRRLRPGMTLEQARPLLPAIARDALAAGTG